MTTAFAQELNKFVRWAYAQSPSFGDAIKRVAIARSPNQFFGDALTDDVPINLELPTIDSSVMSIPDTVANTLDPVSVVNDLSNFVGTAGQSYLTGLNAYYTAKQQIANIKNAATINSVVVPFNQGTTAILPYLLIGGLGIGAILLLSKK